MGPHPAVAAIRLAVRRVLHDVLNDAVNGHALDGDAVNDHAVNGHALDGGALDGGAVNGHGPGRGAMNGHAVAVAPRTPPLVLVACSGGADSMALASGLAFEARKLGVRAGAVTVDHGLQAGSAERAADVARRLRGLGLDPVEALTVSVGRQGGPEAAARDARYAALDAAAQTLGAVTVLLGHTRDDQAETVLLGLARGSGPRSLAGMAAVSGPGGRYRRPFLLLDRDTTRKACHAQGIDVWDDPHNADPAYTRARVRHEALPVLEKSLGRGVVASLARTAQLFRDDADALDQWAARAAREATVSVLPAEQGDGGGEPGGDPGADPGGGEAGVLDTARLHPLPPAVRRRVLRMAAVEAGSPSGSLFARHVEELDRLVTDWRGQGPINLPGGVEARRRNGRLVIRRAIAAERPK